MSFRLRLKYYLVHKLNYAGKAADELIHSGRICINGKTVTENVFLPDEDELSLDGRIIREKREYSYYALHKPRGIESTFSPDIKDNLSTVFPFDSSFFVAGRLDKASEGLLLISDNGKWVNDICHPQAEKEKEYIVEVNETIDEDFISKLQSGVDIGFHVTQPCKAWKISDASFGIILTEGKNRQIRRMCKSLGREVKRLVRTRIDKFYLTDIEVGKFKRLSL